MTEKLKKRSLPRGWNPFTAWRDGVRQPRHPGMKRADRRTCEKTIKWGKWKDSDMNDEKPPKRGQARLVERRGTCKVCGRIVHQLKRGEKIRSL